jgi:hypothetical protein
MTSITPISATDFSTYDGGNYQAMRGIASSSDGTIIYVSMYGVTNIGVLKSTDSGATWNIVHPTTRGFASIACSSDGTIVYAADLGNGLYKSTNSGTTWNKVTFLPDNTLPGGAANPESPAGGVFPGYNLDNNYQIACDSTGSKLIMTTNAAAAIYKSINGGVNWSFLYTVPGYATNPQSPTLVSSNASGSILYAALNNTSAKNIIVSKDSGVTWTSINMLGVSGRFGTLGTNAFGDFIFAVDDNSSLNIFYPTHVDKALLVPSAGNTLVALASYNDGGNLIISQNTYQTIVNGAVVQYSLTNKYSPGQPAAIPCFKDDSKILCVKRGEEVYIKVQDIRPGDLVKTLNHGYVPVNMIGKTKMYNTGDTVRGQNKLYVCSVDKYPELIEDLVITGCHSILENEITEKQRYITIELLGRIMVTDNKYRIMAFLDDRAVPYKEEGIFTIWHIALDNTDYYMNYGIYANGLLVETCSKRYLKELSGMTLIE